MERTPKDGFSPYFQPDFRRIDAGPRGARAFRIFSYAQRGTAIVEAVIALPILIVVILGAIQFGLIYQAKATLNHAALQAARAGAVNNADPDAIRRGLASGLAPIHSPDSSLSGVIDTIARINAALARDARIRVLNPTREAFADFGEDVNGVREIPNDRLHARSTSAGAQSAMNLQDANILRVEITYGYELKVPLVNWFVSRALLAVRRDGGAMDAFERQLLLRTLLPIVSTATVRMQSPARMSGLVVSLADLPEVNRVATDSRAPDEIENEEHEHREEDDESDASNDHGSGLADGFLGYGGGPPDGSGGGQSPSVSGGSQSGEDSGGSNSGTPQVCNGGSGTGSTPVTPSDLWNARSTGLQPTFSNGAHLPSIGLPNLAVGNPIHVVTGNKYQAESDLAPLPGVLGLELTRHYNSEAASRAGVMGIGWRHSYEARLHMRADAPFPSALYLTQADGRRLRFARSPGNSHHYLAERAGDGELRMLARATSHEYLWRWPNGRELVFDRDGMLSSISEGSSQLTLHYNPARRLIRVVDPQQRSLHFNYYANGRLAGVRTVAGVKLRYTYDRHGNLAQAISADGGARRYHYEDARQPHHLTGISIGSARPGAYGERSDFERLATWAYDAQGRAILASHPAGVGKVMLSYGDGYTEVTDAFDQVSRYMTGWRDGIALVTEVRGPGCGTCGKGDVSYLYDESLQLTQISAKHSPTVRFRYDAQQRLIEVEREVAGESAQWLVRYGYEGDAARPTRIERPSVKSGETHLVQVVYRGDGQVESVSEHGYSPTQSGEHVSMERAIALEYDAAGRVIAFDGPRTDVIDITSFEYDDRGRQVAMKMPDGFELRILAHDEAGRRTQLRATGHPLIELQYDGAGRIARITQVRAAGKKHLHYRYDVAGRLKEIERADGRVERLGYDAAGRAAQFMTKGSGLVQIAAYAADDQISRAALLSSNGDLLRSLYFSYDEQRRLREIRDGDGPPLRQLVYTDEDSRPDRIVDPLGFETELVYDALGYIDAVRADDRVTRYARDAQSRLTALTAPNGALTRYTYDDFGRRVREDSPDRGATYYHYDAAGNLIEKIDARGEPATFTYTASNQLSSITRSEGTTVFQYTGERLSRVAGPWGEENFRYDADGRPTMHARKVHGHVFVTEYRYNADGKLVRRKLPSGEWLNRYYRQDGALQAISHDGLLKERVLMGDHESGDDSPHALEPLGRLVFGNRFVTRTRFDPRTGHLSSRVTEDLGRSGYGHDEAGRMIAIETDGMKKSFDYDAAGRLTSARTSTSKAHYGYDTNGNRSRSFSSFATRGTAKEENESYTYEPSSNRLLSVNDGSIKTFEYDAAGHPTRVARHRYEYDSAGRPIRLFVDDRLAAQYAYNIWGERIRKTVYSSQRPSTTFYVYERHRLIAEADDRGRVTREYLYLEHHPVAMLENSVPYWIHTDHLGTPVAVTDGKRSVVWRAEHEPFGHAQIDEDPDDDGRHLTLNLRFPGQYADAESGTHYNIMRDYDPDTGRYLTPDPLGMPDGSNSFAYVHGNPLSGVDPLGLYLFAFDGTWIDRARGPLTNVELFRRYYDPIPGEANSYYRSGIGTSDPNVDDFTNSVDRVLGGAFGLGGQSLIRDSLLRLDQLIAESGSSSTFDGIIDIVGFSRGAAIARAFANQIYERVDRGYYTQAFEASGSCRSLRVRFMGLFDTVGSFGVPGNSIDIGYDLSIDGRVGTVAHAVALNEHRAAFDLVSIQHSEHSANTTPYREERGFIGAHSDIGGGYSLGDLSDVALQWMHNKAMAVGIRMLPLANEQLFVRTPIIHDERRFSQDREIFYPNDPNWEPEGCEAGPIECLFWQPPATQRQATAPQFQFQELREMIEENSQPNAVRGTVDMERYRSWLRSRGQL